MPRRLRKRLRNRRIGRAAPVLLAAAGCALSSWLTIPASPVPITMQTFAVTLAGALLGPVRGTIAVLIWLAAGALGAPVLAGGAGGIDRFSGPGAGYLFAFPLAAWVVGRMARRGWMRRIVAALAAMAAGNAICLAIGAAWLATTMGVGVAFAKGVLPFLPGAAVKSFAAALVALLAERGR